MSYRGGKWRDCGWCCISERVERRRADKQRRNIVCSDQEGVPPTGSDCDKCLFSGLDRTFASASVEKKHISDIQGVAATNTLRDFIRVELTMGASKSQEAIWHSSAY
jgi:hypothetical protein